MKRSSHHFKHHSTRKYRNELSSDNDESEYSRKKSTGYQEM